APAGTPQHQAVVLMVAHGGFTQGYNVHGCIVDSYSLDTNSSVYSNSPLCSGNHVVPAEMM
ncbi:MAG: hypothetical protein ABJQ14_16235, partial [Hyphomicrobiales bacterium]